MSGEEAGNTGYDEGEHCKDVFAYFGRAFYEAGVVETGLALTIMHLDFITKEFEKWKRDGMASFDRAAYDAAFDNFMEKQHGNTFGNLIKTLKRAASVPDDLATLIDDAKVKRDFLTHHFFRDRALEFGTRKGRDAMIAELDEAHALFLATDRAVTDWARPYREKVGLSDDAFERFFAEFKASLPLEE